MNSFRIGMKVVCIDSFGTSRFPMEFPEIGSVYEIRGIHREGDEAHIWLVEIVNPAFAFDDGTMEPAFSVEGFRPVVERGTEKGMSILREILTKTGQPVEEVA